jgi:polyribonucleotide nucleotidyltransferase
MLGLAFLAACSYSATPHATNESELTFLLPKPPSSKLRGNAIGVSSPSLGAAASGAASASGAAGVLAFTVALATAVFSAGGRHRALIQRYAGGRPLEELNVGEIVAGTVKRVANIGVWIDIGAAKDALLAKTELPPGKSFKPGEKVTDLEIIEVQAGDTPATRKIRLKAKQAELDVKEGDVAEGTVQRASSFGVFFDIGIGVDVLGPSRNLSKKTDEYTEGEKVKVKIESIAGNRITVSTNVGSSEGGKGAGKTNCTAESRGSGQWSCVECQRSIWPLH